MANRRKPLTFSELDNLQPKGKGAILRSAEEVAAEQEQFQVEELEIPDNPPAGRLENDNTNKQENKKTRKQGSLYTGEQGNQETSIPMVEEKYLAVASFAEDRSGYKKSTYRISTEALDALEDTKRLLRRTYGLKVTLEGIVEAAILEAQRDLLENKETSSLVNKFSGKQANQ